ncbi:MAG TPA: hypothetical protein VMX13_10400 [Sedimentisphaerales bacterium]|nr:hypothetical protein [Sedimentisphaerales bacterium]
MRRSHVWAIIVAAGGIGLAAWIIIARLPGLRRPMVTQDGHLGVDALEKLPYTFDFDGPHYPEPKLVFEGPFPNLPETMRVYQVGNPAVTEEYVRELARKHFGMPADAEITRSDGRGFYWLRSSTHLFHVDPGNGSFNTDKISRIREDSPETWVKDKYPSKEECGRIAEEYLKTGHLLEPDAYLRGVADNISGSGVMSVGFGRLIGGCKTWGAGAQILVRIGLGGEVVGVRKAWQELIPYRPYPVKSPEEALAELQQGKGLLMNGDSGKVKEITLRYYTSPQKQDYVQPIYYFDCNGPEGGFYGVLPAIKGEYLEPRQDGRGELMAWIMCRECGAIYQINLNQWHAVAEDYVKEHPDSRTPPPLVCQQCGQKTAYRAIECDNCGLIFEAGWKGPDYYDRCSQCGFSKVEERLKERRSRPR